MNLQLMRLRKEAGYRSRKALADAIGGDFTERKIKSWEEGARMMSFAQACDIADFLNCTLDELAGRDFSPSDYSDPRQRSLNHCYGMLDERSKGELAGLASTMTADASRLAAKSGQDSEDVGLSEAV